MVVPYARSGSSMFPQVRYRVRFDGEPSIRTGRLLKPGDATYFAGGCYGKDKNGNTVLVACRWGDNAGAAVDPADDTGIWIAQQYANGSGGSNIWVGRVF